MRDLLLKYSNDKCSKEELEVLFEWLKTEEGEKALSAMMDEMWAKENGLTEADLNPRLTTPATRGTHSLEDVPRVSRRRLSWKSGLIAASISLFMVSGLFMLLRRENNSQPTIASPYFILKQNEPGAKSTFILPDGTIVKLNADSELKFANRFDSVRDVYLKGEAFFEVAKDPNKPFVVHVNELNVTALGTAFNVKAFQSMDDIDVSLTEGKVNVSFFDQSSELSMSMILNPGEKANFDKAAEVLTKLPIDEEIDLGWRHQQLVFRSSSFDEIKVELERWYGVEIHIDAALTKNWEYTGVFDNAPLERVLIAMMYPRALQFQLEDKEVTIYK